MSELLDRLLKWDRDDLEDAYSMTRALADVSQRNGYFKLAFYNRNFSTQAAIALNILDTRAARETERQLTLVPPTVDQG